MKPKITKRSVESIKPAERDVFLWDTELTGFGCKATPKGSRVYLLQYWRHGRARRYTIGRHGQGMTAEQARHEALRLKAAVAKGADPAQSRAADCAAPTFADLAARYMAEHALVKKKPSSAAADARNLRHHILPVFQGMKIAEISRAEVARFHHAKRTTPGAANRCLALLSKMFNLAERWGLRPDGTNPTRHLEKYPERKIERFLSNAELGRLGAALAVAEASGENPQAIAALRLLIFTGCRRNEILTLRWEHVDFENACLRLPDSKTGTRTVPLGAPALEVLGRLERVQGNPYVFCPDESETAIWWALRRPGGASVRGPSSRMSGCTISGTVSPRSLPPWARAFC